MGRKIKKILITSETRETFVMRHSSPSAVQGYCFVCGSESQLLTFDSAVGTSYISGRKLIEKIENGEIHTFETDHGGLLLCRNSLTAYISGEKTMNNNLLAIIRSLLAVVAIVALTMTLPSRVFAAPGDLDPSFSGDGKLTLELGPGESEGFATALQTDGKIVVAGRAAKGSGSVFALARYNSDGSLDLTFGNGGKAFIDFDTGENDLAQKLAIQADGKIVVVGASGVLNTTNRYAIARLNSDGSPDTTFDLDGMVTTDFGVNSVARCVAIQGDGKIVVGGEAAGPIGGTNFALSRYNTDGALDNTFDGDGVLVTDFNGQLDEARGIALQLDGKVVLAGTTLIGGVVQVGVARYDTTGVLDNTFDGDGKLFTGHGGSGIGTFASGTDVALQSDGKIVVSLMAGTTTQFGVVRLNSNGSVDGTVRTTILAGSNVPRAVRVQSDGKIVIVGSTSTASFGGEDFAAIRFNSDLTLDTSFSGDGKVRTDFDSFSGDIAYGFAIEADGSFVLGGTFFDGTPRRFALLRYASDGTLDTSLDIDGKRTDNLGSGVSSLRSVAVQSDGKIVAVGSVFGTFSNDFAVHRFNTDGTADTTFDGDGIATTDFSNGNDEAMSVAIQSDGKILVAGRNTSAPTDTLIARYNADGTPDTTFAGSGKIATGIAGNANGGAMAIAQESNGKIIVAGFRRFFISTPADITMFRLSSTGNIETIVATDVLAGDDIPRSIAIQSDGKILVATNGIEDTNQDFAVLRYNTDLTLDTTFSGDGMVFVDFGPGDDIANSLAIQSDGKIVVAGSASNGTNTDLAVARLNSNGTLDTTFSGDGRNTVAVGTGNDAANSIKIQTDGKIITGGSGFISSSNDFATVRFNSNGSLDSTLLWGTGGVATSNFGGDDKVNSIAIQSDGKIIAAGESSGNAAVARYIGLGPTSAGVAVSGRVTSSNGAGLRGVKVSLTDSMGVTRLAITGSFGYYRFDEVAAGGTYILTVSSKRNTFASPSKVISATDELTDVDFVSNE